MEIRILIGQNTHNCSNGKPAGDAEIIPVGYSALSPIVLCLQEHGQDIKNGSLSRAMRGGISLTEKFYWGRKGMDVLGVYKGITVSCSFLNWHYLFCSKRSSRLLYPRCSLISCCFGSWNLYLSPSSSLPAQIELGQIWVK